MYLNNQIAHLWILMWVWRVLLAVKHFPQISHVKGFSPTKEEMEVYVYYMIQQNAEDRINTLQTQNFGVMPHEVLKCWTYALDGHGHLQRFLYFDNKQHLLKLSLVKILVSIYLCEFSGAFWAGQRPESVSGSGHTRVATDPYESCSGSSAAASGWSFVHTGHSWTASALEGK